MDRDRELEREPEFLSDTDRIVYGSSPSAKRGVVSSNALLITCSTPHQRDKRVVRAA